MSSLPHVSPARGKYAALVQPQPELLLRPELLLGAMAHFVACHAGRRFAERPPLDLGAAFGDAKPHTPLIFVLTSGADPLERPTILFVPGGAWARGEVVELMVPVPESPGLVARYAP